MDRDAAMERLMALPLLDGSPPSREVFDNAVAAAQHEVDSAEGDPADLAFRLFLLDQAGYLRNRSYPEPAYLDASIATLRRAVVAAPPADAWLAEYHGVLARQLTLRFGRDGDRGDFTSALTTSRTAVELTAPGHPHRARRLVGLAELLRTAAVEDGNDPAGFAAAISANRLAVEIADPDDPRRGGYRFELATTLLLAARATKDAELLRAAHDEFLVALETSRPYDPDLPRYQAGPVTADQAMDGDQVAAIAVSQARS
jgi:hypothetical protein